MRSLAGFIIVPVFLFSSCGVFIRQPKYIVKPETSQDLIKKSILYPAGGANFVKEAFFENSEVIIICVPGLGGHSGTYKLLQEYFSKKKISTVSIDLRGFGHWEGKKGDVPNLGIHISDINTIVCHYRKEFPDKRIILLGESLGTSLCLWYNSFYPSYVDGLVLTSLVTRKGGNDIKFKTKFVLGMTYAFCPSKPVSLGYNPSVYSNDSIFIRWETEHDSLVSKGISPRYMIEANRIVKKSPALLCSATQPILLLQGGKDFLSDRNDILRIIKNCSQNKIEYRYFENDFHSLVNDSGRNEVYDAIIKWLTKFLNKQ